MKTIQKNKKIVNKNFFDFQYVIGKGGFGKVWKVQLKKTKEYFALKEMSKVKIIDKNGEQNVLSERKLLSKLHNPFIVNIYFAFQDFMNLYLVMDLLSGGDLRYNLAKKKYFSEKETKFIIANIILGLEYIHNNNIIHRDIKPENLVCDINGYFRITDFGIAKINEINNSSETSGTIGYMSPEVLFGQNHTFYVDFFALGIICYEFLFCKRPYKGNNREEYKENILNFQAHIYKKDIKDLKFDFSIECIKFINGLLMRNYKERLGYNNGVLDLKNHSWMKDINWELMKEKKLIAPFIPDKNSFNFDKKYCENIEKIDHDALGRYHRYINNELFLSIFDEYYYFNYVPKKLLVKELTKSNNNEFNNSERNNSDNKGKNSHINQNLFLYKNSANMINQKGISHNKNNSKLLHLSKTNESTEKPLNITRQYLKFLSPNKTFNKANLIQSESYKLTGNNLAINKLNLQKLNKREIKDNFNNNMDNSNKSLNNYQKRININYYNTNNDDKYNALSDRNNESHKSKLFYKKTINKKDNLNKFRGVFVKKDPRKTKIKHLFLDNHLLKNKIKDSNNESLKNLLKLFEKRNNSTKHLLKISKKPTNFKFDLNFNSDLQKKEISFSNTNKKKIISKMNKTKIEITNNNSIKPKKTLVSEYKEINSI